MVGTAVATILWSRAGRNSESWEFVSECLMLVGNVTDVESAEDGEETDFASFG